MSVETIINKDAISQYEKHDYFFLKGPELWTNRKQKNLIQNTAFRIAQYEKILGEKNSLNFPFPL
jgi:hypothetical protein